MIEKRFYKELDKELLKIALCIKMTRKDGVIFGFTTHTEDVVFDDENITYKSGFISSTAFSSSSELNVNTMNNQLYIDYDNFKIDDLEQGLFNDCEIEVFRFLWNIKPRIRFGINSITDEISKGWFGDVSRNGLYYETEFLSLTQPLQTSNLRHTASSCDASFCDKRCKLNAEDFTTTGTIEEVINSTNFKVSNLLKNDDYFNKGVITFTSGEAKNKSMEVKKYIKNTSNIELQLSLNYNVKVGDTFSIIKGCDKTKTMCKNTEKINGDIINNIVSFKGFSFVPGIDKQYGGLKNG